MPLPNTPYPESNIKSGIIKTLINKIPMNNPNNKEKRCCNRCNYNGQYCKWPGCPCHSTPPVEKEVYKHFKGKDYCVHGNEISFNCGGCKQDLIKSPQSNTMEWLDEKLEDLFNEAVRACLKHLKSEITEKERDEILKDLDTKGKIAIQNALSQVRKETIRACVGIAKKSRTLDEHLGIGIREETARQQVITDLLSKDIEQ